MRMIIAFIRTESRAEVVCDLYNAGVGGLPALGGMRFLI